MRQLVTPANIVTSGNLTAGFLGLLAVPGNLFHAMVLVTLAAGLDSLDGVVARRMSTKGMFGTNLDSLADLVSFGVVPAVALYLGVLHTVPVLGLTACLIFLLCGAWRLARFPLIQNSDCFVGLPIPPAGVLVMLLAMWGAPPILALLVSSGLSILMISEIPFPTVAGLLHWKSRCFK